MDGVETWSRTLSTEQCLASLSEYGVPSSAYRTVAEALSDPQLAHRGALAEVQDDGGTFKVMNLAVPDVRHRRLRRQACGNPWRAHGRGAAGERPFRA